MAEVACNNTITITKGDSAIFTLDIFDRQKQTYTPVEGDTIRFAVKKNYTDAEPLIVKDIPIATMELILMPEDTKNLESGPVRGRYKYDIELHRDGTWIDTVIPRADFIVLEEVL